MPSQNTMFSIVSAIRWKGECKKTLNDRITISTIPRAKANSNAAAYKSPKTAGFAGAGREIPVPGTCAKVKDVKKLTNELQSLQLLNFQFKEIITLSQLEVVLFEIVPHLL